MKTHLPRCQILLLVWLILGGTAWSQVAAKEEQVQAILKKHCFECHGVETQEADLRLDTLSVDLLGGADAETWHDVLNKLNLGEMPPEEAEPIGDAERDQLVDWITEQLRDAAVKKRLAGGRVRLRRLTRYEYNNTMRDLLGVQLNFAENLPPEPKSTDGFKNNAAALGMSPLQMELYLAAARRGLKQAIVTGDAPQVVESIATESAKVRRKKMPASNRLVRGNRFLMRLDEFPREGEVIVRVRATAKVPDNAPLPRLRITLGVRADVRAPEKIMGEADVKDAAELQTFEFRGRIEDFPLPGHNPKFPGLQVTLYNQFDDNGAKPAKKPKKKKQKKGEPAVVESLPGEAEIVIESVEFVGPIFDRWPPAHHRRIFFENTDDLSDTDYVREVVRRFIRRAYRRPPRDEDVALLMRLYEAFRLQHASLEETLREVLAVALISPDFLYLVEPSSLTKREQKLSDHELASRLSYFLWSSMPDAALLELADEGGLSDPAVLAKQVERMLADERSQQFVLRFADQWLDLSALDRVAVNPEFHPNFDERLKADMRAETRLVFAETLNNNLSVFTLLDADFTLLNRRLAKHYGIDGPRGLDFERVPLAADNPRGGLLTQGSFLLANSNGEQSHPIKRAVWLLDRLLDMPPAPPPPDVPELDPSQPDFAKLSLKQQLEAHRTKPACNSCHRRIDPWGVAFENFDAVGRWRETATVAGKSKKRREPIDATAELPDGSRVEGVAGLKQYLLGEQKRRFARALVKRMLAYALGRTVEWSDQAVVADLSKSLERDDYRLRGLVAAIVQSEAFQSK